MDLAYGRQIMEGTRPGRRDDYLALAFVMRLEPATVQQMLAAAVRRALHPMIKRDAALIFALTHGYGLAALRRFMTSLGVRPLETGAD
jgi:hypothetical protein